MEIQNPIQNTARFLRKYDLECNFQNIITNNTEAEAKSSHLNRKLYILGNRKQ